MDGTLDKNMTINNDSVQIRGQLISSYKNAPYNKITIKTHTFYLSCGNPGIEIFHAILIEFCPPSKAIFVSILDFISKPSWFHWNWILPIPKCLKCYLKQGGLTTRHANQQFHSVCCLQSLRSWITLLKWSLWFKNKNNQIFPLAVRCISKIMTLICKHLLGNEK